MHVALWSSTLPDSESPTGILTYVKIMREALIGLGHRVTVLALDGIALASGEILRLDSRPDPLMRVRWKLRGFSGRDVESRVGADLVYRRLRQAHRIEPIDIFEVEESFGWAAHLARRSPCPIVVRLHGPHFLVRENIESPAVAQWGDRREISEKLGIMAADAISCPSAQALAATLAYYGLSPAIAETIPNPIQAMAASSRWSPDRADAKQIMFVGRFDLCKGADILVQAFARAAAVDPALRLVIAGPDNGLARPDGSRTHFGEFLRDNVPPEVAARIRFLGAIPSDAVLEHRLASGFSLVLSRFENFPYSIAEGMAVGAPMIVSDTFGGGEMVEDGRTGMVVPVADVAATTAAILKVAGDPAAAAAMGARAYDRCAKWLSPARIAADTVALYERVLRSPRRR